MADNIEKARPASQQPDTSVGRRASLDVDLGIPLGVGQANPTVHSEPDHGLGVDIEGKNASLTRADKDGTQDVKLDADGKPIPTEKPALTPEEEAAAAEADTEAATAEALPAFDAAVPDTVEAYDKAFRDAEGTGFNMPALSADWSKNAKTDPKTGAITGSLSEDTYKYLETKGIDRATVKAVEDGMVARMTLQRQEVFTRTGGEQNYAKAIEWARKGGYDAAATAKFNKDLNAGGPTRNDAVDLLMQRFNKANPAARRASPNKTTADAANPGGGQGGGAQGYKNYGEYQVDLRKARETNNQTLLDQTRARLKASEWHKK